MFSKNKNNKKSPFSIIKFFSNILCSHIKEKFCLNESEKNPKFNPLHYRNFPNYDTLSHTNLNENEIDNNEENNLNYSEIQGRNISMLTQINDVIFYENSKYPIESRNSFNNFNINYESIQYISPLFSDKSLIYSGISSISEIIQDVKNKKLFF